ncbi:hypothetical protein FEV53_13305 [Palleronia caenipelagi]|uniref:DUF6878 domain-containing protein n=2 Tax=Palleronia caenipelagi TaxID=2489174 RepID=A0A547PT39_9RHOB|nr:hypothetical protein FEV53_13305 [Palleronia caenipelagi]
MMEKWRLEREEKLKGDRATLLEQLREIGLTEITAEYEGSGDSGHVGDITDQPADREVPEDVMDRLKDFAWDVAYDQHPGFENNDGAYGSVEWDLTEDSITLDHTMRYTETCNTYQEGL